MTDKELEELALKSLRRRGTTYEEFAADAELSLARGKVKLRDKRLRARTILLLKLALQEAPDSIRAGDDNVLGLWILECLDLANVDKDVALAIYSELTRIVMTLDDVSSRELH